ncbi:MAG: SIR2 family protein [Verrucomicrobia bacterium]|nr:SIR2 family protein [Verrucomicrobiota bacterium]
MDTYLEESFADGNVQLFVGSGLSRGLYPDSKELREKLLDDPIVVDANETTLKNVLGGAGGVSLEDAAEFYELNQGPEALMRVVKRLYGVTKKPGAIHDKLWKLPHVRWIYTTNFDCLVEDALGRPKQPPEVITRGSSIPDIPRSRRVVFKPHGCARKSSARDEFVITRNDYLNYSHRRTLEMLKTLYDISTKVFLFIGYSLRDLNMRHIITEACRIAKVRSYAILHDTSGPESRYWQKLGVTLVQGNAEDFVTGVLKSFPAHEFEFDVKADERIEEKDQIAIKALQVLKDAMAGATEVNVMIDAGSTTLQFAKVLARAVLEGTASLEKVRIVTNSPLAMDELTPALRRSTIESCPTIIGGPLRFSTRAYTPDALNAQSQLKPFADSNLPTLAFVGASAVDEHGLKTKTEAEVAIKKAFIEAANEVYVLVDHDKTRSLPGGYVFSEWDKERMTILTDRVLKMSHLEHLCKAIK